MISRDISLFLVVSMFAAAAVDAQPQQTVEGAQQFLANVVAGGKVNAEVIVEKMEMTEFSNNVRKKSCEPNGGITQRKVVFPVAAKVRSVSGIGGTCSTLLNGLESQSEYKHLYCYDIIEGSQIRTPIPRIHGGLRLDWSTATVERGRHAGVIEHRGAASFYPITHTSENTILVSYLDQTYGKVHLQLAADPEMADRVEYAIKFLQMSCDSAASTGF